MYNFVHFEILIFVHFKFIIYIMNRKDVEAYQKSYEEIDIFLKQFPHLKNNINEYLGKDKTEKKESVIGAIKKHKRKIDKTVEQSHSMSNDIEL